MEETSEAPKIVPRHRKIATTTIIPPSASTVPALDSPSRPSVGGSVARWARNQKPPPPAMTIAAARPASGLNWVARSEERRVGKECRAGWAPERQRKKEE